MSVALTFFPDADNEAVGKILRTVCGSGAEAHVTFLPTIAARLRDAVRNPRADWEDEDES